VDLITWFKMQTQLLASAYNVTDVTPSLSRSNDATCSLDGLGRLIFYTI
jgi:hypothetical protein